ncbi:hypothetical protein Trydic_g10020 [Trypoxylus dichotomus]
MEKLVSFLPENDVLHIALSLLELIGESMHYSSKKLTIYRTFNVIVLATLLAFVVGPLFQADTKNYVQSMEAVITVTHPLIKYLLFLYNKSNLERLLDEHKKINCTDGKLKRNFLAIEAKCHESLRIIQLFLPLVIFVIICYMLKPSFDRSTFLVETLLVDSIAINAVVLALEYYLFALIVPILFSYDCLYIAQCVYLIFQLKRLNHRLQCVLSMYDVSKETTAEFVNLIRHHQYLIR